MSDTQVLALVATHLVGTVEAWWDSKEDEIKTWAAFEVAFLNKFASVQKHHTWWNQIENKRQKEEETIEEVANELKSLFQLVGVKDDTIHIRYLLALLGSTGLV